MNNEQQDSATPPSGLEEVFRSQECLAHNGHAVRRRTGDAASHVVATALQGMEGPHARRHPRASAPASPGTPRSNAAARGGPPQGVPGRG